MPVRNTFALPFGTTGPGFPQRRQLASSKRFAAYSSLTMRLREADSVLAISRKLVELQGGKLELESELVRAAVSFSLCRSRYGFRPLAGGREVWMTKSRGSL